MKKIILNSKKNIKQYTVEKNCVELQQCEKAASMFYIVV